MDKIRKFAYEFVELKKFNQAYNVINTSYLSNENPHVRNAAIIALGKINSGFSKNKLLQHYDQADWTEKGLIILSIRKDHSMQFN